MLYLNQATIDKIISYLPVGAIVALGNGEGTSQIINAFSEVKGSIDGIVCSTKWNERKVREMGLIALDTNDVNEIDLYVDTALEANTFCTVNKGEDIELLRNKFLSQYANKFICCIDDSRLVDVLGRVDIAVEVIPDARSYVSRKLTSKLMSICWNTNNITENGNHILLIKSFDVLEPLEFEKMIESIPGVLACSIFSVNSPNTLLVSKESEVIVYKNKLREYAKNIYSKSFSTMY